jgi:hypothetical protein
MPDDDNRRHIYLTAVRAEKADEFEEWLSSTVAQAERQVNPERLLRWQALRATAASDDVLYFAFILDGGEAEDWGIDDLVRAAFGDDAAKRAAERWDEMVVGEQLGATFRPLEL